MISSVDLAHYGVSCAKDWVSVDCGTSKFVSFFLTFLLHYTLWPLLESPPGGDSNWMPQYIVS